MHAEHQVIEFGHSGACEPKFLGYASRFLHDRLLTAHGVPAKYLCIQKWWFLGKVEVPVLGALFV